VATAFVTRQHHITSYRFLVDRRPHCRHRATVLYRVGIQGVRNMKTIVCLFAALTMTSPMASELVSHSGNSSIRLTEQACTVEPVLKQLAPGAQSDFRAAFVVLGGNRFKACWRPTPGGAHLLYEDGDQGLVPLSGFRMLLSV